MALLTMGSASRIWLALEIVFAFPDARRIALGTTSFIFVAFEIWNDSSLISDLETVSKNSYFTFDLISSVTESVEWIDFKIASLALS